MAQSNFEDSHNRSEVFHRTRHDDDNSGQSIDSTDIGRGPDFTGSLNHLPQNERRLFWIYGLGQPKPVPFTAIHHAFEYWAQQIPDATAVEHLEESISYDELNYQAERLARLLAGLGVKPGDIVPLFVERSIEMVVGIMAILKVGASYAPQDARVATARQLVHVADSTQAKLILTLRKFTDKLPQIPDVPYITIDGFLESSRLAGRDEDETRIPDIELASDSLCMVLFTSGTTGNPNGVKVTHKNLCNILLTSPGNLDMQPGDRVGQILSISFDMAAWETLGCLVNGATLLIRSSDIAATAQRATVLISTPSILGTLHPDQCGSVRVVAVAGEPCPRHVADSWSHQSRFFNACGPTETTIVNTMHPHEREAPVLTIGKPTPNNTVYILDEAGKACRIGDVGEMWAGGDCVTDGYLNNPELSSERYRSDVFLGGERVMFNTRDLGRWTENGLLEHLGRTDDQVKVRGFRVELDSVSAALEAVAGCRRAAVLKYDDRHLVAFVSPETVDTEVAQVQVADSLPYYCRPAFIVALPELPLTSRGKIDKRKLMDIARQSADGIDVPSPQHAKPDSEMFCESAQPFPIIDDTLVSTSSESRADAYLQVPLPEPDGAIRTHLTHHTFYHYWRLLAFSAMLNILAIGYGLFIGNWWSAGAVQLSPIMNMVVANISVAILFRQQYVINFLFRIATSTPLWMPLGFRQLMGKVYHFGGLHLGGAICGTLWMLVAIVSLFWQSFVIGSKPSPSSATLVFAFQIALLLMLIVVMARPAFRARFHNGFELMHRLGGWLVLLLFWAMTLSFVNDMRGSESMSAALSASPIVWSLLLVSFSIALPWMRLKRVPVQIERPSDHVAIVHFDYGVTPFAGSATTVSRSPLTEWHSFANVPSPQRSGYRLTISRAGDWTGRLIDDMPSHLWVKGIPTAGVGNVDKLFRRVVWIATGSGIGPALPHLLAREVPAHLIWSTRNARKTYGDKLVDEIMDVEPDALIWDTDSRGRPDLVQLAYAAVQSFDAEAVIVIANEKVTRLVVHGMESRSIPAYGAIWDS